MITGSFFSSFILPQYIVGVKDKFINMLIFLLVDDFFANFALSFIFVFFRQLLYKKVPRERMFCKKIVQIITLNSDFSSCYLCTRITKYGIIFFILLFCYRGVVYAKINRK